MTDIHGEKARDLAAAVLEQVLKWKDAGAGVVLATVVKAWSTAPRRAGTQLAVHENGTHFGTLFGASVDTLVVSAALGVLAEGKDTMVKVSVDDATASAAGMACGGGLEIRLECIDGNRHGGQGGQVEVLREALDAMRSGRSVVLCTGLSDGRRLLISSDGPASGAWASEAHKRARMDDTAIALVEGDEVLFQVFNAPLRLFVVGAVRTARALRDAAQLIGFEVTIIEPRAHAVGPEFSGANMLVGDVGATMRSLRLDSRCAVVVLAHAPEIDDPALIEAVRSHVFYIGALGSRKSHAARLARLEQAGVPADQGARIHGPAGLDIGAIGPAEIAASIVAEMVAVLRKTH
ncbi:XdhC family protein [Variovorax sp. dw_308]|uniref:XdhC family protein n=1 Tax=Variovorax sp. dw_308 TaxID=2721546 RepID=UPI001C448BF9|nr:XdhC/CoxI family protein [Variovorax sp. dw_308]